MKKYNNLKEEIKDKIEILESDIKYWKSIIETGLKRIEYNLIKIEKLNSGIGKTEI